MLIILECRRNLTNPCLIFRFYLQKSAKKVVSLDTTLIASVYLISQLYRDFQFDSHVDPSMWNIALVYLDCLLGSRGESGIENKLRGTALDNNVSSVRYETILIFSPSILVSINIIS